MKGFGPDSINRSSLAEPLLLVPFVLAPVEPVKSKPNKSFDADGGALACLWPFVGFSEVGLVSEVCFFKWFDLNLKIEIYY